MNALISFSEDLENGDVLISYGPAPYCGNLGMISFLDRCLSRLYKIASRDLWAYQKLVVFQEASGIAEFSETITTLSSSYVMGSN